MNFMDYFGGGNAAGGMRMPQMGTGMDLYGAQPSSNLGLSMPANLYAGADGTGIKPPASFGQMPTGGMNMQTAFGAMQALGGLMGKQQQQAPQIQPVQLPSGSNQNYEQLMKMYGVRSGGLLG
jgi:hypothetical protein